MIKSNSIKINYRVYQYKSKNFTFQIEFLIRKYYIKEKIIESTKLYEPP